jgi:Rieske Fe-S protein
MWAGLAAGAALAGAGTVAYLWPLRASVLQAVGAVDDYSVGDVRFFQGAVPMSDRVHGPGYYVVRRKDGFVAFAAFCTHQGAMGCTVPWRPEREFFCPCHGGSWTRDTGDPVVEGMPGFSVPHHLPPLPLVSLPIRVRRRQVQVGPLLRVQYRQLGEAPHVARL